MKKVGLVIVTIAVLISCKTTIDIDKQINVIEKKTGQTLKEVHSYQQMPRAIENNATAWKTVPVEDWTSGFWPGVLWYTYEASKKPDIRSEAEKFTSSLTPLAYQKALDHDLGFMLFCSFGNGYRLTKNPGYKKIILAAADSLATLYDPRVGTICSWPRMVKKMNWPHNTIIDNMMNLEMLFWAAKNGPNKGLYDIAVTHALTTMQNHFRDDYSAYHVVVYDTITGKKIKGVTHQGLNDSSMWARGQAWAIYGFTMCYRETKKPEFLAFARHVADIYLKRLPGDGIPFWDFDAPLHEKPVEPKDASAAAITASALLELSELLKAENKGKSTYYKGEAVEMLHTLSGSEYSAGNDLPSFLLHSTGHKPEGKEVDVSIIYADYYYLEALLRLKKINDGIDLY